MLLAVSGDSGGWRGAITKYLDIIIIIIPMQGVLVDSLICLVCIIIKISAPPPPPPHPHTHTKGDRGWARGRLGRPVPFL